MKRKYYYCKISIRTHCLKTYTIIVKVINVRTKTNKKYIKIKKVFALLVINVVFCKKCVHVLID